MKKFFDYDDRIVPPHHPRVIVETAVAQGASRHDVLDGTGITETRLDDADSRISYVEFGLLARNALRLTGNPALGLDAGSNLRFAQMGVLGIAIMSSRTIGAALDVFLHHGRALAPSFDLEVRTEGDAGQLFIRETISMEPLRAFAYEVVWGAVVSQGRWLYQKALPIRRARFAYARPEYVDRYAAVLPDVTLVFGAAETVLEFDRSVLDAPVAFADPATARLAEEFHAAKMPDPLRDDGLIPQVRRLLAGARGRPVDPEHVAHALETSVRSLQRALKDLGTSFQSLCEESRRSFAEDWVGSTDMNFDEVAERLAFADARSFRRAFKRWTGQTPGEFRRERTRGAD